MPKQKKDEPKKPKPKNKKAACQPKRGRLIALDGTSGPVLAEEAQRLARLCGEDAGWSLFDASNTFHELGMTKSKTLTPTPRVLVLLYVSDLLFRLRWEIEPALQEGQSVVAAPYVQTAVAFGVAAGMSGEWLEELFSFAPAPAATFRLKEKKKAKSDGKKGDRKRSDTDAAGYFEFCSTALTRSMPGWNAAEVRAGMIDYFKKLEESNDIRKFGKKAPKDLAG